MTLFWQIKQVWSEYTHRTQPRSQGFFPSLRGPEVKEKSLENEVGVGS